MQQLATIHLNPEYTEAELEEVFSPQPWTSWFLHASAEETVRIDLVRAAASSYTIRSRAVHVYAEAERVQQFLHACEEKTCLSDLGSLMNASMLSCTTLYDCSCPELNELTKICTDP